MKIALDFDNTFTADPELWSAFINTARQRGHEVKIVTSRAPYCPVPLEGIEIVYCSFTAKKQHYPEAHIWIDDDPLYIHKDHGT